MIIIFNGPLGIGKSTVAESINHYIILDSDHRVSANPPPIDEMEFLHSTIALLGGDGHTLSSHKTGS
jgi:hypothetical protein